MLELNLSLTTITILAWSKFILFTYCLIVFFLIWKKPNWSIFYWVTAIAIILFYVILAWPLQRMWWGTVGDELFTASFLAKVLLDNPFRDFFYGWLPPFYPPLYFWLTGLLARPLASNAIVAAKLGVSAVIFLWFFGPFIYKKLFQNITKQTSIADSNDFLRSKYFWGLIPLLYLALLDFDTIILKPYEALSALGCVLFSVLLMRSFYSRKLTYKHYLFFGISGGLLFLSFYFWWIIIVPALLFAIATNPEKKKNFLRLIYLGLIIFLVSTIYTLPLLWSYLKYGFENGQAVHFVPSDFFSFMPWKNFTIQGFLSLLGLAGLVLAAKKSYGKIALLIFIFCYVYQFINIAIFLGAGRPVQASKGFWFLGSATLALGLSYLTIYLYQRYFKHYGKNKQKYFITLAFFIILLRLPMVYFIDDPVVLGQIEKNLVAPTAIIELAENIKTNVFDYQNRIWLSSGSMELGAYLPLSYYIAPNVHFSHHASVYSRRFAVIKQMTEASSAKELMNIMDSQEQSINALLLYYNPTLDNSDYYSLYFWEDNFPNGGKDSQLYLPKKLITEEYWTKVYNKNNWEIYLKK